MGEKFNVILGRRIRILRRQMQMSQEELGALLGYHSSGMISQVENGLRGMDREKIKKAAEIFGVPFSVMMSEQDYSDTDLEMFRNLKTVIDNPYAGHYDMVRDLLASAVKPAMKAG